jgi:hypothetical protein
MEEEDFKFPEFGSKKKKIEYTTQLYQSIAIDYAIYEDIIYVAEKFGIDIKEMEVILSKKEFQKQSERIKEQLRKKNMDPETYKKKLLAMKALDEISYVAFGPDSRNKLGALRTLCELADELGKGKDPEENKKEENKVILNIRKEGKNNT